LGWPTHPIQKNFNISCPFTKDRKREREMRKGGKVDENNRERGK